MNRSVLITRPNYDYTTRYISAWAKKVIEFAEERGYSVFDLDGERAKQQELASVISKKDPTVVMLNGHGDAQTITGQHGEVLVKAGTNEDILKAKIVYALSCGSAKILGPKSIEKGAYAYIGYDEDFIFMYSNDKRTRPLEDKTAALFLDPSIQFVISLLKGNTVGSSLRSSRRFFIRNIQKLLTSQSSVEESSTVRYLLWDMEHQLALGDVLVKLRGDYRD